MCQILQIRNAYKLFVGKPHVRRSTGSLGTCVNCTVREKDVKVRGGMNWLRTECNK
jgi:hypothetical protein